MQFNSLVKKVLEDANNKCLIQHNLSLSEITFYSFNDHLVFFE